MKLKRAISIFLCCLMLVALLPTTASAADVTVTWSYSSHSNTSPSNTNGVTLARILNVNGTSIYNVSQVGVYLYNFQGTTVTYKRESPTPTNGAYIEMWYPVYDELGYALTPGAFYSYQFVAVINGTEYWSDINSFTAVGTPTTYTVTLDATGGSVYPGSTTVCKGNFYGELPTPTRPGYQFRCWSTDPPASSSVPGHITFVLRITASSPVITQRDHTLYAHWNKVSQDYTVTFNVNGGSVDTSSKTVTVGEAYGDLPTPVRSGYTFDGWYTSADGGSRITSATVVDLTADQTLYAHWTSNIHTPTLWDLTYNFGNSNDSFGYSNTDKIPLARYQLIFGNTALARYYYNEAGPWGGSCYGMASTSSMFFQDSNNVSVSSFKNSAHVPAGLGVNDRNNGWSLTVKEFIEAMQISQRSSSIQIDYQHNKNQLNNLCQAVDRFSKTGSDPVVVAIFGKEGGHALIGYDIVDVSGTQSRLMVYDPNYPNTERYITLAKNSFGQYNGWYYHLNDVYDWGSSYSGSWISYVPYSDFYQVWANRAGANDVNLLTINTKNAVIKDVNGSIAAKVQNGEIITNREDIYPLIDVGIKSDGNTSENGISLWLPTNDLYTIINADSSTARFEAAMVHMDQSVTVSTTASEVTLAVDDSVELSYVELPNRAGNDYEIVLNSTLSLGHSDVQLSGTTTNSSTTLAQVSGDLYADGVDLGRNATLRVDGRAASSSILSGSTSQISSLLGTSVLFSDVASDSWYAESVSWAVRKGITTGTTATTFTPSRTCTVAEILTFLWRAAGEPEPAIKNPYGDISPNAYYYKAALWAYEQGIETGYTFASTRRFDGNANCTRSMAVTYIWKLMGRPTANHSSNFTDVPASAEYARAVAWAVERGVTNGISATTFSPNTTCTRAQIVTFLYRAYE